MTTREDLEELLGEGMHAAFRKACDCPEGMQIHHLIDRMPPEHWATVVGFVAEVLHQVVVTDG